MTAIIIYWANWQLNDTSLKFAKIHTGQIMPTISTFYGILIKMFFNDHLPAHFHAEYAEFKATIDIEKLEILEGELPRRALELVLDWAELHKEALLEDWNLCQTKRQPKKIEPLR